LLLVCFIVALLSGHLQAKEIEEVRYCTIRKVYRINALY
jgi:hypothetical protein